MCALLDRGCVLALLTMPIVGVSASTARAGVAPEACCRPGQPCIDLPPELCSGRSLGVGTTCAANGAECNVPTVGEWGLVVMALAVLIAGTIVLRRRSDTTPIRAWSGSDTTM
ncbi:MAG: IPTL-CTERM sorting domain-containing protein, partial [Planctomycetota bacterium]